MKVIEKQEPDLIFVQEPYEYQNRPVGIGKKYRIFTAGMGNIEQPSLSQITK
jgi:hypothetical protein